MVEPKDTSALTAASQNTVKLIARLKRLEKAARELQIRFPDQPDMQKLFSALKEKS